MDFPKAANAERHTKPKSHADCSEGASATKKIEGPLKSSSRVEFKENNRRCPLGKNLAVWSAPKEAYYWLPMTTGRNRGPTGGSFFAGLGKGLGSPFSKSRGLWQGLSTAITEEWRNRLTFAA